ncbi:MULTISPECIES: isoprenylcysteine carboxylmethyltransferase family protein [Acidithrix]|uniref:Isoprenylcysteine carboxyl methyltransferase (ICMT) family protein n=1 Tax=Acidithrix ferrooxidans TaxID=1280514 RepID=A0A0D8HCS1_9ACTN|nr:MULTISPECIES: isoprenylcysteine carboxylmethyltransferase family protein [Acidithrix]KJF15765.1 hypothetical protein AXFE_33850 [Acidithrix ferrooxidans]CAG4934128.1 unnamed protein product [Acidithrix sp. C25]
MSNGEENSKVTRSKHIPPPLLFVLATTSALALDKKSKIRIKSGTKMTVIGRLAIQVGITISTWSLLTMKKHSQNPNPNVEKTELIQDGPFKFSRNPIYLGAALSNFGAAIANGSITGVVLNSAVLVVIDKIIIPKEEAYLTATFSDEYNTYQSRVARWISIKG